MSRFRFFILSAIFACGIIYSSQAQDRFEKRTERASCFSGRLEVTIQHCTPGKKDGSISLELPGSAGISKVFWIGFEVGEEARKIDKIPAGYYTIVIFDKNNCSTRIENVQVKEVL